MPLRGASYVPGITRWIVHLLSHMAIEPTSHFHRTAWSSAE
ncbi:hypothetical protein CCHR01_11029 [Colletotrichum chrysophilum]|uniref:Uncharacterized protein n=1 Tax=Colletotrichum chrysophilum TaxID=1836956 RepID=A0AAD9EFF8_9PEZI|nr:hypothetical protein CCHR01_11029 [Colletotrichum chrysophilum]